MEVRIWDDYDWLEDPDGTARVMISRTPEDTFVFDIDLDVQAEHPGYNADVDIRMRFEMDRPRAEAMAKSILGIEEDPDDDDEIARPTSFPYDNNRAVAHQPESDEYDDLGHFEKTKADGGYWLVYHEGMLLGEVYQMGERWFHAWMRAGRHDEGLPTADEAIDDLIYAYANWTKPAP